jgi:hypothetical protein
MSTKDEIRHPSAPIGVVFYRRPSMVIHFGINRWDFQRIGESQIMKGRQTPAAAKNQRLNQAQTLPDFLGCPTHFVKHSVFLLIIYVNKFSWGWILKTLYYYKFIAPPS